MGDNEWRIGRRSLPDILVLTIDDCFVGAESALEEFCAEVAVLRRVHSPHTVLFMGCCVKPKCAPASLLI